MTCSRRTRFFLIVSLPIIGFGCQEPYHTDRDLLGRTDSAIIAAYDAPDADTIFTLTANLYEYQNGLLTLYPDHAERRIEIREMFWEREDGTNVAVWFERRDGRWVVVDNLIWQRDEVQF